MFTSILSRVIAEKDLVLIDAILTFFCTLYDMIYFRNACSISEPLVQLIDLISKKSLTEVLKVIKRELDCKFSNWTILCSTMNLIVRLLMKEETAACLVVNFLINTRNTRTSDLFSRASSRRVWT